MGKIITLILIPLFFMSFCKTEKPVIHNPVIAKIDNKAVYEKDLISYYSGEDVLKLAPSVKKRLIMNMLVDMMLNDEIDRINTDGEKVEGFIKNYFYPENVTKDIYERFKRLYLVKEYLKEKIEIDVTDEDIERYYNENQNEFLVREAILVSQLFFDKQSDAEKIRRELINDRKKFEEYASIYNKEPYSQNNGNLGWVEKGELPPEFEEVIFKVNQGGISRVLKSEYGYHVFYVRKKTVLKITELKDVQEDIKNKLTEKLLNDKYEELIKKMFANRQVFLNEGYIYR